MQTGTIKIEIFYVKNNEAFHLAYGLIELKNLVYRNNKRGESYM